MPNHMEYYKSELARMADSVKACNIAEMLDLTDFFIAESNTHMAGIDKDVQDRILYYTRKYKQECTCIKR